MVGLLQGSLDVPFVDHEARGDASLVPEGLRGVEDRGEGLEVQADHVRRLAGQLRVLGHGEARPVAHEAQDRVEEAPGIVGGEHRHHPREGRCIAHVDTRHPTVGEGRAPDGHVQRPGSGQVAGEGGLAGGSPEGHSSLREAALRTARTGRA